MTTRLLHDFKLILSAVFNLQFNISNTLQNGVMVTQVTSSYLVMVVPMVNIALGGGEDLTSPCESLYVI